MQRFLLILTLLLLPWFSQCMSVHGPEEEWQQELGHELEVLGARNWIVIAEPSFSALSGPGAKTIVTHESSPQVLSYVLNVMSSLSHTEPRIYLPLELGYVGEDYAPGIKSFRKQIKEILLPYETQEAQHETLRRLMLDAARNYNVLVVKTSTILPFSNIYMELDSGYWNSDSETQLRRKMEKESKKTPPVREDGSTTPSGAMDPADKAILPGGPLFSTGAAV